MPLTLRANVGDCLKVKLTNKMKESRASFSAFSLAFDPKDSQGSTSATIRVIKPWLPVKAGPIPITPIRPSGKRSPWCGIGVTWP